MFANIRRHQKWLWILISGAVIISFVWYFNPNSRQGQALTGARYVGSLNGRPISYGEYRDAEAEAQLQYFFNYGSWYGTDEFSRQNEGVIQRDTRQRILLKQKVKDLNIHVTPEEIGGWIQHNFGRERAFTEADYNHLVKDILAPRGIRERDFENYVAGQLAILHLINVAGLSGKLVTPQEAEQKYRQDNEEVSAEAIFFEMTNYLAKVKVDDAGLGAFYTNRAALYRVPDKIQLAYVEFPASNYFPQADQKLSTVTNLSMRIDELYQQRGAKFYTNPDGSEMTPEAAKQKIHTELRTQTALTEAHRAATAFAEELLAMPGAKQISNLESLAAKRGIPSKTTEPFTQAEGPRSMEVPGEFGKIAFQLTPAEPFIEEPIRGSEAVYIAGLKNKIPSEIPPLDKIKDQVAQDYKRDEAQKALAKEGQEFQSKLTNAMAAGKSFTAAASELGQKVVTMAPFSRSSRSIQGMERPDVSRIIGLAFTLKTNEVSSFTQTRDGGFIEHVNNFIPVDEAKVKAALPAYMAELERAGQNEAFQAWFNKQLQTAHLTLANDKETSNAQ